MNNHLLLGLFAVMLLGCDSISSDSKFRDDSPNMTREADSQINVTIAMKRRKPLFSLPESHHVKSMTFECYNHVNSDVPPTEVPETRFNRILERLADVEIDVAPDIDAREMGTLQIRYGEKESLRVCWYYNTLKNGGSLSVNGIRVRLKGSDENGGANWFDSVLRTVAEPH